MHLFNRFPDFPVSAQQLPQLQPPVGPWSDEKGSLTYVASASTSLNFYALFKYTGNLKLGLM